MKQEIETLNYSSSRTVVVDTDSRFLDSDEAYRQVASVTRSLYLHGYRHFFKKIDSTLRGNIADEIAAVMDAGGFRFTVVAPAAPRNGRTVKGGMCMIHGIPLSETSLANDPFTPVVDGKIANHLARKFSETIADIPLSIIRSSTAALEERIREGLERGIRVFIADAETMDDLKSITTLVTQAGILFAGASGLAEAVANGAGSSSAITCNVPRGQMLFAIGSLTERCAIQCRKLVDNERVHEIVIDSAAALDDAQNEIRRITRLVASCKPDRPLLIRTDCIIRNGGLESGSLISRFIGEVSREIIGIRAIRMVFASGGDTAARIVERLDVESIRFVSEIVPGIPFGYMKSAALGRRIYFISKSGGFGGDGALVDCLRLVSTPRLVSGAGSISRIPVITAAMREDGFMVTFIDTAKGCPSP